jgi:hypothetical protein
VRATAILVLCATPRALAEPPPTSPIRDSSYSIELYDGAALGNTAVVGMGGATLALSTGTSGTLFNPAAAAVRATTDNDRWSWDYHLDYLNSSLSTDYDNNGFQSEGGGASIFTFGLAGLYRDWALAFTATTIDAPVAATTMVADGREVPLTASAIRFQFALARWIRAIDTSIGVSATTAVFDFGPACTGAGCESLFSITGGGLEAGVTWAPRMQDVRLAASVSSRIAGGELAGCDPADCAGWVLPERVVSPWRVAGGVAYRRAASRWNQQVPTFFRDETALTLAADVFVHGSSPNAYGLESFGNHVLQRSGRHATFSPRAGLEYEWMPGRLRLRTGTYWEPGRFVGVPGRLHVTFGVELRIFHFWLWGKARRGRISLTGDLAERYRNGGLSIGLWH